MTLKRICSVKQELVEQQNAALEYVRTLLETFPIKEKRRPPSSSFDRRNLEEYLRVRTPELPDLSVMKQIGDSAEGNKIRHLEQELERCKKRNLDLYHQVGELTAEIKQLKKASLSQIVEIKESPDETQRLKISTEKEALRGIHQQGIAHHKRNDSYSKISEYTMVNEQTRSNVSLQGEIKDIDYCREKGCVQREEYDGLKEVLSKKEKKIEESILDIERINNEKKKLEDDIKDYERELANTREQYTDFKAQIFHHEHEASSLKSQLQSQIKENKELQDKILLIEKGSGMLKSSTSNKKNSDKAVSDRNDFEVVMQENVKLQREIELLQSRRSEREGKLIKSQEVADHRCKCSQNEKDRSKQIIQGKAVIEKKMNEINCELKAKIDEENHLKCSLDFQSTSRKHKQELDAIKKENRTLQELRDKKHIEMIKQKETSDDRLSQMQLDSDRKLKELSNAQMKIQNDASDTEAELRKTITKLKEDLKKKVARTSQLESQIQGYLKKIANLETDILNERKSNTLKQEQIESNKLQLEEAIKKSEELKSNLIKTEENTNLKVKKSMEEFEDLLQDKIVLTKTLTDMKKNMKGLQVALSSQKETFDAKVSELAQDKKASAEKIKDLKKNMQDLQATLSLQKETFDTKVSNLMQENKVLMENLTDTKKNMQGLQATLLSQKETFDAKVSDLTQDKKALEKNIEDMNKSVHDLQAKLLSKKETFDTKLSNLMKEKKVLTENLTDVTNRVKDLQGKLTTEKVKMEAKVSDLTQNLKQSQERNSETEKLLISLQQDKLQLEQMYDTAKEELDYFKSIKVVQIQLYHNSRVPLVSKVENELKSKLKQELESHTAKLEFIDCEKVTDVDPNKPLLILCICASRLGTDAANAIQSLKLTSHMALLVFHHKDGHALPNQASEHVLTGNEYKRLGGIFDFGFLSDKGMYSSEMNERNLKNILHFLNKEGTKSVRK